MTRTPETLPKHELVGLPVSVTGARNEALVGIDGRVVRETMHTLVIRSDGNGPLGHPSAQTRQVPKEGTTFTVELPAGRCVRIDGDRLVARPARRTETTGGSAWV